MENERSNVILWHLNILIPILRIFDPADTTTSRYFVAEAEAEAVGLILRL